MRMDDGDRVASFARVPQGADDNGIVTGLVDTPDATPESAAPAKRRATKSALPELVPADGDGD